MIHNFKVIFFKDGKEIGHDLFNRLSHTTLFMALEIGKRDKNIYGIVNGKGAYITEFDSVDVYIAENGDYVEYMKNVTSF